MESFISNDSNYTREKANAENVTLPLNFQKITPPIKLDNTTVRNYLIDQNNISMIAGISANDSCIVHSTGNSGDKQTLNFCNPPDVQVAPGRDKVIEMTNNFIGVWNKSDLQSNRTVIEKSKPNNPIYWTNNFFKVSQKNDTFDPSIIYDSLSRRWLSTLIEFEVPNDTDLRKSDKMGVLLSYSEPDDYKRWTVMKFSPRLIFPTKTSYFCPDRPMIYTSTDKVLVSMTISAPKNELCDERNNTTRNMFMSVFNKSQLFDDTYRRKDFNAIKVYDRNYHYVPVKSHSNKSEINLVNVSPYIDDNLRLSYIRIDGTLKDLHNKVYDRDLAYNKSIPSNAVQKGTNTRLYLADNRIIDAVETNSNETWITFHNNCKTGDNNTSCIRLVKLSVDDDSLFKNLNTTKNSVNATGLIFEGGNTASLNNLPLSEIREMAIKGDLPPAVTNNVLSHFSADPEFVPIIVGKVSTQLDKILLHKINNSEIVRTVGNASLPLPVANNVVSEIVANSKLEPKVLDEIRHEMVSPLVIKRYLDFQIGSDDYYYYYPTIAVSKNGSLVVYFGFSSKYNYPSLGLLVLNANSLSQSGDSVEGPLKYDPILVKNGTTFAKEENITDGGGCDVANPCTRYGDYFSIKTDPYDDSMLWAAGEYYDDKYFSTIISNIRLR